MSKQALKHPWAFKKYLRTNAFGWRGSSLAIKRLGEAVSEIKAVARTEPVTAAEGVVQLCERMWPALQQIDTSSGGAGHSRQKHPGDPDADTLRLSRR